MTTEAVVKYTQTFKKYRAEFRGEVVQFARDWAKGQKLMAVHEDASIFKVTGAKDQIDGLLAQIKEKFNWVPPTPDDEKK